MTQTPYPPEYFEAIAQEEGPFATRLAEYLAPRVAGFLCIDLGCGPGIYTSALRQHGVECIGIDSSPYLPTAPEFKNLDLTSAEYLELMTTLKPRFCLCLEVFEHLPEALADRAVSSICATAPWILFSAAHPGQGGLGHVNCQPKSYWLEKFCHKGFYYCPEETTSLVHYIQSGYHMGWAAMNAMVLRKCDQKPE